MDFYTKIKERLEWSESIAIYHQKQIIRTFIILIDLMGKDNFNSALEAIADLDPNEYIRFTQFHKNFRQVDPTQDCYRLTPGEERNERILPISNNKMAEVRAEDIGCKIDSLFWQMIHVDSKKINFQHAFDKVLEDYDKQKAKNK